MRIDALPPLARVLAARQVLDKVTTIFNPRHASTRPTKRTIRQKHRIPSLPLGALIPPVAQSRVGSYRPRLRSGRDLFLRASVPSRRR